MPIKAFVFDAYGTLYDVHSVIRAIEAEYPGRAELVTQIWRLKQLEYSWLRSLLGQYRDFHTVTRESLTYTLDAIGLPHDAGCLDRLTEAYNHLTPYPDAAEALDALTTYTRAILSNGTQPMLDALVRNTGLADRLDAVLSVDAVRAFKPMRGAYTVVTERLGLAPEEVMFVTSNGFDVAGASAFGFHVARVVRMPPASLHQELAQPGPLGAAALYRALRSQNEALGYEPTVEVTTLRDLAATAARFEAS